MKSPLTTLSLPAAITAAWFAALDWHASDAATTPEQPKPQHVSAHVAVTRPSKEIRFGGPRAGRIARILVRRGATVEAGQLLFEMDNEVERLEFERLQLACRSTATVDLAEARLAKAQAEADRIAELGQREIASGAQQDEARANLRVAEAELAHAREQQTLLVIQRDQAEARYELLRGRSPFAGRVETIHRNAGEGIDSLEPVLDLVVLDPLYVEFPCPADERQAWRVGTVAEVTNDQDRLVGHATVTFCGERADIASQTVTVRLELPNAEGRWLAGRRVTVRAIAPKPGK